MSTLINNTELREIALGRYVQGKTSDVTSGGPATYQVFTVVGGEVLITALWGKVTTSVTTNSETLAMQTDPTAGDTVVFVEATDIGTTDTVAGTVIGFTPSIDDPATNGALQEHSVMKGGHALRDLVVTTGEIEAVVTQASANGVIEWYCTYVPLTAGASVAASA